MSHPTPTTKQVRLAARDGHANRISPAQFDRWLQTVQRDAQDDALRRPRELTTAEELDALPDGAMVLTTEDNSAFQKQADGTWRINEKGETFDMLSQELIDPSPVQLIRLPSPEEGA